MASSFLSAIQMPRDFICPDQKFHGGFGSAATCPFCGPNFPTPIVIHPSRPWSLFEDAGPTLRATRPDGDGDHDLAAWGRLLAEYAELQRSVESEAAVALMLAAGTPDGRPDRLPAELERLLEDERIWAR